MAIQQIADLVIRARDLASRDLKKTETRMQSLARVAARTLPIALGVAAGATARLAINAANAAQQITKAADAAGLSTDTYQALAGTLQAAGVSTRNLDTAMRTLQKQLSDAARGESGAGRLFAQLGIDIRNANGELLTGEEALLRVSDGLSVMESQTEKAGIAAKLLGRNYGELLPFLGEGEERIRELNAAALDSGQVISRDLLEAGQSAAEAWDNLGQVLGATSDRFWLTFAPALKSWADWANDYAKGVNLRWVAEQDAGGLRELRGELHNFSAAFDDYTRRWEGEQGFMDPFSLIGGAAAAGNLAKAVKAWRAHAKEIGKIRRREGELGVAQGADRDRDLKELDNMLEAVVRTRRQAGIVGRQAASETRKALGITAGAATAGTGIAYALRSEIPHIEKAISDINRIVAEANTKEIIEIDNELEKTRQEMFRRGYEQMLLRDGATAEAERDLYAKREAYFLFAEHALAAKRKEIEDEVATARAARQAALGKIELNGEQARAAKAAEVWDKYYTTLELERARADGNEEKAIHDQTNKREVALRAALKQYLEADATANEVLEKQLQGMLAITALHNRNMDELAFKQRTDKIEWERQMWDADTQSEMDKLEARVDLFKQEQDAYKNHLETLDKTQQHYWTIERERRLKHHEMRRAEIDLEYKAAEDRIGIANYALQAGIAINRKGERESRDQFERRKQLETSLAIINTASAATAVMKNAALAGGWSGLAIAEMSLILAAGFQQVRAIQDTTYNGGGSLGSASGGGTGGTGSTGDTGGAQTGFTQNTVINITGGNFTDSQVRGLIEAIGDEADRNGGRIGRLEVRGGS